MVTEQVFFGGIKGTFVNNAGSKALYPFGLSNTIGTFSSHAGVMPCAGILKDFRVVQDVGPGTNNRTGFFLGDFDAGLTISGSLEGSQTTFTTTDNIRLGPGNRFFILIRRQAGGTSDAATLHWSFRFRPDNESETILGNHSSNSNYSNTVTEYVGFGGIHTAVQSDQDDVGIIIPCNGTFKNFFVEEISIGGPGDGTRTHTIMKDTGSGFVDTSLVIVHTGIDNQASNTSDSFTVNAGDRILVKVVPTDSPGLENITMAVCFVPDVIGNHIMTNWHINQMDNTQDTFQGLTRGGSSSGERSTTEAFRQVMGTNELGKSRTKFKAIYVKMRDGGLGASQARWVFTLRKNGVDTPLFLSLADGDNSGNAHIDVDFNDNDLFSTEIHPIPGRFGGPNVREAQVSYLLHTDRVTTVHIKGKITISGKTTIL